MKTLEAKPFDQNAENWKRENRLVVAPFSKGQDGFCDYLYKVSTKQTPRQSSHSTAPIEGKDNTELDR